MRGWAWLNLVSIAALPYSERAKLREPIHVVSDPQVLSVLEQGALSFARHVGSVPSASPSNQDLVSMGAYAAILGDIERQLGRLALDYGTQGARELGQPSLFPVGALRSPAARFALVGIVNRLDRAIDGEDCGEVRFIYRLTYETVVNGHPLSSRLPMTANVIYRTLQQVAGRRCGSQLAHWIPPAKSLASPHQGGSMAEWLMSEPLAPILNPKVAPPLIEVNLQSALWSAGYRPDLAGNAEYWMRGYQVSADRSGALPVKLENMLDADRLAREPALRGELIAWLKTHVDDIDRGNMRLPLQFLADEALSVSPHGAVRRQNHPFSASIREEDLDGIDLSSTLFVRTPAALLHRLDLLTCNTLGK